jgi:hypothetical protein
MLETHLAGKTTKKRQISNTPKPTGHILLPHTTIHRETRRAPAPPDIDS